MTTYCLSIITQCTGITSVQSDTGQQNDDMLCQFHYTVYWGIVGVQSDEDQANDDIPCRDHV